MNIQNHLRISLFALLAMCLAGTAQATDYSLAGDSGAQLHIGNGLALPVQSAVPALPGGQAFPPLLVGVASPPGPPINGNLNKIVIPPGQLSKPAAQATVGVFFSNTSLYAVATSLNFVWPTAAGATFSTGALGNGPRPLGTFSVIHAGQPGNQIRYSERVATKRFGGAGRFALAPGGGGGGITAASVTLYALAAALPPPGTFPAVIIAAYPTGAAAPGGPTAVAVATPGGPQPAPDFGTGMFGAVPAGTVSTFMFGAGSLGVAATAASLGYPWTTARVTVSATLASPMEKFIISGNDLRGPGGAGVLQMVAGSLSLRGGGVGPNANRAWLRLNLEEIPLVPALTPLMRGATVLLMIALPTVAYAIRSRRRSA